MNVIDRLFGKHGKRNWEKVQSKSMSKRNKKESDNPGGILGIAEKEHRYQEEREAIRRVNDRTDWLYKALLQYFSSQKQSYSNAIDTENLRGQFALWEESMEQHNGLANQKQYFSLMATLERQASYVKDLQIKQWVEDTEYKFQFEYDEIAPPFTGIIMRGGEKSDHSDEKEGCEPVKLGPLQRQKIAELLTRVITGELDPEDELPEIDHKTLKKEIMENDKKLVQKLKDGLNGNTHTNILVNRVNLARLVELAERTIYLKEAHKELMAEQFASINCDENGCYDTEIFDDSEEDWLNEIVEDRIHKLRELLVNKGNEYARSGNKFHNFDRASELNDTLPARELHGFLTKHLVSYMDMLDDMENGEEISEETIEEKFGDIITYFVLQEALFYRDAL